MAIQATMNGSSSPVNGVAKKLETLIDASSAVNGTTENTETSNSTSHAVNGTDKPVDELPVEKGSISESKNIYRGPKNDDDEYTWLDKDEPEEQAAENETTAKYAVIIRKKKSSDSRKVYEAHSLIIQSPLLREALGVVFKDYPDITPSLERFIIDAPFSPFVHRWTEFLEYMERKDLTSEMKSHLKLLHDILDEEIGSTIKAVRDYISNKCITWEDMWTIFAPGSPCILERSGYGASAFELRDAQYIETRCGKALELSCKIVDLEGDSGTWGWTEEEVRIYEFRGTRKINSLKCYPLRFHEKQEQMIETFTKRGKAFEQLKGYNFKSYDGAAISWNQENQEVFIQIQGRIIVDRKSFNRWAPCPYRDVESFTERDEVKFQDACNNGLLDGLDDETKASATVGTKLTPYHQMLVHQRVRGYSLKLKQWLDFFVDNISDIEWNDTAFDRLVLPADQKEMILALSEAQIQNKEAFDDVVKGKGQGMICLLSGPPGVGKTLTAEATAEALRVPLHSMSSGDLGSNAGAMEMQLSRTLDMVARWNAVLLIDECDVFLEARSVQDLERNRVVSIFLRTLEYYTGVLFLTTNRVKDIDAAFQSRIHISIAYPDLTKDSRHQIWTNFLTASQQLEGFTETDLADLSALQLNGRQIKNVLRTAQLLASRKKEKLNRKFVNTVLAVETLRPDASHMYM